MRKVLVKVIILILIFSAAGCAGQPEQTAAFRAAVYLENTDDSRLMQVHNVMQTRVGQWEDIEITLIDYSDEDFELAQSVQETIDQGYNLVVFYSELPVPDLVLDGLGNAGIPLIIWNAPSTDDQTLDMYEQVWLVGCKAEEAGWIQGQAAAEYWRTFRESDRNRNWTMEYVVLMGRPGWYDTMMRSRYAVLALQEQGIPEHCLATRLIESDPRKAQKVMAELISLYENDIEFILCTDDELALGAIWALQEAGYFGDGEHIPVLGAGASEAGLQEIRNGTLLTSSQQDVTAIGETIMAIIRLIADGRSITLESLNGSGNWMPSFRLEMDEHGRILAHYRRVDALNIFRETWY